MIEFPGCTAAAGDCPSVEFTLTVERYEKAKAKYDGVTAAIADNLARSEMLGSFIRTLEKQDGLIAEFDERLWSSLVDCITVYSRKDVRVVFRNGTEISAEL